jgi:phosphopantetheine adenylyltransferase
MAPFSAPAPPTTLVLLPPDPSPRTSRALLAAALRHAKQLALREPGRRGLVAALPLASLTGGNSPRAQQFAGAQVAVAGAYRAAVQAARAEGVEVAADLSDDDEPDERGPDSVVAVDVSVVLVPFGPAVVEGEGEGEGEWIGPVVSFAGLARRRGGWEAAWAAESAGGERVRRRFEELAAPGAAAVRSVRVPDDPAGDAPSGEKHAAAAAADATARCKSVIVGGTFDHLHVGHKLLLTMTAFALDAPAAAAGDAAERTLTVGMTAADLLAKKKYAEALQPWRARTRRAHAFLRAILRPDLDGGEDDDEVEEVHAPGPNGHAVRVRMAPRQGGGGAGVVLNYVEIWDPYGPTITDAGVDTLVVSAETRGGGQAVNDKRRELGWVEVVVHEVDVLDAREEEEEGAVQREGFEDKLSSTEIRRAMVERRRGARSKV